jgi:hypothetical protein
MAVSDIALAIRHCSIPNPNLSRLELARRSDPSFEVYCAALERARIATVSEDGTTCLSHLRFHALEHCKIV